MKTSLLETALTASLLVDGDLHLSFTNASMEATDAYINETDKLRRFMEKNPRLAYVYTTRMIDGNVHFILDAALPGDIDGDGIDDHSYIMDVYETPSEGLLDALTRGDSGLDKKPYQDQWGIFISGYAPIRDSQGNTVGILGADLRVENIIESMADIRRAALGGIALAFVISTIAGIGIYTARRRSARSHHRAQEALDAQSHAETNFRRLFEQTPIGIMNYNRNLIITDCNREFSEIIRTPHESLIGMDMKVLKDTRLLPCLQEALQGKDAHYTGAYHTTTSNRKIWIELKTAPIRNAAGEISGAIAILEDITSRQQTEIISDAEKQLLAMIARAEPIHTVLEKLITSMETIIPDSICSILFVDEHRRRFTGGIAPNLASDYAEATYSVVIGPETGSCGAAAYSDKLVIVSDIQTHPYWANYKELAARHNLRACWSMPIHSSSGAVMGTFAIYYHEIYEPTEWEIALLERASYLAGIAMDRARFEKELAQERQLLRNLIDHLPEAVFIKDLQHRYRAANPAAARYLGVEKERDLIGKSDEELLDSNTANASRQIEQQVLTEAAVIHNEAMITLSDGAVRRYSSSHMPLRNSSGDMIGLIMIAHDITDLHRAQEEQIKIQKLESLGQLAGGIAHDFNNILTSILGNLSMLRQTTRIIETESVELLHEAESAALRARDLAKQLITFAKGGLPVRKPSDVDAVIREAATTASQDLKSKLSFDIQNDLWTAEIDPIQIGHVVHNLVVNADEAMPGGGPILLTGRNISLSANNINELPAGDYVSISIHDEGAGIEPTIIGKIFDPYFTTKKTGSGLGLSTAFSIIAKHNGKLFAQSQPGQGTTLTFLLPALRNHVMAGTSHAATEQTAASKPKRILIMDDEEAIVKISSRILERAGYRVEAARNGQEAVRLYAEAQNSGDPFDLVVLDLTIPGGMGGRETFGELHKLNPQVKAVVSSGYSPEDILARHESFGFCGVITKPYQREDLVSVIDAALKLS